MHKTSLNKNVTVDVQATPKLKKDYYFNKDKLLLILK